MLVRLTKQGAQPFSKELRKPEKGKKEIKQIYLPQNPILEKPKGENTYLEQPERENRKLNQNLEKPKRENIKLNQYVK